MPYIVRPGEPYPWFAGTARALDQIIGIDQQGIRDQYDQLGEQRAERRQIAGEGRHNAEYDRRTAEGRTYAEGQQAAERKRKGGADSLMLTTLQGAGLLPRTPELDAAGKTAAGGVDLDMNTLVRMYAQKVLRDQEAARAAALLRAAGVSTDSPPTVTMPQEPSAGGLPQGFVPGRAGPVITDPGDAATLIHVKDQRARDAAMAAERAADNARAQAAADEAARHHKATEGAGGPKAAVDQADAEISFLRQKLTQWQQDFKDAQAEIRDRGEATPELTDKLEKARAAWNRTNAEIKAKLAQRGATTRQYPADVTTEAERREYDALLGRE